MRRKISSWARGLLAAFSIYAADQPVSTHSTPSSRVDETYNNAKARYQHDPANATFAWQFASACFDQGEFSQNNTDRARVANEGIHACRLALLSNPALAPLHYYLGMDIAQLARTKLWSAIGLLTEVEKEWLTTIKLDENFDYSGADRNLGLLYRDAPGWPLSIGNRSKARLHLLRAVQLHPEYPENHLNLLEFWLASNNIDAAAADARVLAKILPAARKRFSGPDWESSWDNWDKRRLAIQTRLNSQPADEQSHSRK